MSPDAEPRTLKENILWWLRYIMHRCYDCGWPLFFSPFTECEACSIKRIAEEKELYTNLDYLYD